jgi:HAMP domain-containing protein
LLVILALVSLVVLSRELRRQVVSRLSELELVAKHLSRGDRRRRASETDNDELGMLARELNRALDALDSLEGSNAGFQQQQRQLLLSVLLKVPGPAAILAPSGARIASTLNGELDRDLDAASGTLGNVNPDDARTLPIEIGGSSFTLEALITPQGRITGWLVRPMSST